MAGNGTCPEMQRDAAIKSAEQSLPKPAEPTLDDQGNYIATMCTHLEVNFLTLYQGQRLGIRSVHYGRVAELV